MRNANDTGFNNTLDKRVEMNENLRLSVCLSVLSVEGRCRQTLVKIIKARD